MNIELILTWKEDGKPKALGGDLEKFGGHPAKRKMRNETRIDNRSADRRKECYVRQQRCQPNFANLANLREVPQCNPEGTSP